jgi:hypothetical protein
MIQLSQRSIYTILTLMALFVLPLTNQALSNPKADSQSVATFYVH